MTTDELLAQIDALIGDAPEAEAPATTTPTDDLLAKVRAHALGTTQGA